MKEGKRNYLEKRKRSKNDKKRNHLQMHNAIMKCIVFMSASGSQISRLMKFYGIGNFFWIEKSRVIFVDLGFPSRILFKTLLGGNHIYYKLCHQEFSQIILETR